jgi:DNA ligase-1
MYLLYKIKIISIYIMFPILYRDDQIWKIDVQKEPTQIVIEYGKQNLQTTVLPYTSGKNIGKKNETTPYEQAIKDATSKWNHKKKEGYHELDHSHTAILPMLATPYKSKMKFPLFVQPKLDGLRCIVYKDSQIRFQSRTASLFTALTHLEKQFQPFFEKYPDVILDGELYTDKIPFEQLAGLIKRKTAAEGIEAVEYHVYDVVMNKPFAERYAILSSLELPDMVKLVFTTVAKLPSDIHYYFSEFSDYEGIMMRDPNAVYQHKRTLALQKYKEFQEAEFPIIGFSEGTGRDANTVIWICQATEPFSVRPKGTYEYRHQLFIDAKKYVGKLLTVIYQELTDKGIPRFPVGKAIREDY